MSEIVIESLEELDRKKREEQKKTEKENFGTRMKAGAVQLLIYFGIFAVSIIIWELILRIQIGGGIKASNLFFLFFVPAQAMVLAAINGFVPRKVSRFLFPATLLLVAVFYGIQLVYFRIFGSLLSVYLLGMGTDAVGNFGWAMQETIVKSIGMLLLLMFPAIATRVLCILKKVKCEPYPLVLHAIALGLGVLLWFGGAYGIIVGGDERASAYYAFHSNLSDTDTTASRVGTMTTTLVEAGSYYLALGSH